MIMRYRVYEDSVEVVDSVVADVLALLGEQDAEVVAKLQGIVARGAHRVARFEVEYLQDGQLYCVADHLEDYLQQ